MSDQVFDTIIIGAGISGMTAGIILAKEGEQVLVLEQHRVAGGLTQTYSRKGSVFPTGVHRLGSLQPGQPLLYYFKHLGLMERLDLVPLDKDCFEQVFFPSQGYRIPIGRDRYRQRLLEYFPEQAKGISRYFNDFETAISNIRMYNPSVLPEKDRTLAFAGPLKPYLESIGISGHLKNLITANSPLYGLSSDECPLITHFLTSDSYLNSCFRINEEKTPFSQALVDSLQELGGQIRVNARVNKVRVKEKAATGVVLASGEVLSAKKVVFSGHPSLLLDICSPELFRPVYRKRLNQANTPGSFGVALKWQKQTCPFQESDAYIYDSRDVDYQYRRGSILDNDPLGMVYLSALPNTPASGKSNQDVSVTALTGVSDRETSILMAHYNDSQKGSYKEMKKEITGKILGHIARVYPQVYDEAVVVDTYSSVTFQRYTLTRNGSAYGIKKTAQRFMAGMFSPATKVRDLFLTGQSIGFNGVHGSLVSSVNLCAMLLGGDDYLMAKIRGVAR